MPKTALTDAHTNLLSRINPLLLPLPWLVVAVLVIVFVTFKYTHIEDVVAPQQETVKVFPHTFITNVEMRHYDQNGQLHYQMNSPLIRSFQVNASATADDYSLFQTPVFILINNPNKPGWYVTAQEGRLDSNNEWFTLIKDVIATQTTEKDGTTTITTSDLRLNTREQFAETSKAVTMRAAKSQITGIGMRADIKRENIQLLSNVKGTYEP